VRVDVEFVDFLRVAMTDLTRGSLDLAHRERPSKRSFSGKFAPFASVLSLRDRRPWVDPLTIPR
jgi:hypothetical protein